MALKEKKRSIFTKIRNYFIAGVVVLIPIGIIVYLTIFITSVSLKILPKEINPNNYLVNLQKGTSLVPLIKM